MQPCTAAAASAAAAAAAASAAAVAVGNRRLLLSWTQQQHPLLPSPSLARSSANSSKSSVYSVLLVASSNSRCVGTSFNNANALFPFTSACCSAFSVGCCSNSNKSFGAFRFFSSRRRSKKQQQQQQDVVSPSSEFEEETVNWTAGSTGAAAPAAAAAAAADSVQGPELGRVGRVVRRQRRRRQQQQQVRDDAAANPPPAPAPAPATTAPSASAGAAGGPWGGDEGSFAAVVSSPSPPTLPSLPAIGLIRRPAFPGFYQLLQIPDQELFEELVRLKTSGGWRDFVGGFLLRKEADVEEDMGPGARLREDAVMVSFLGSVSAVEEIHPVGCLLHLLTLAPHPTQGGGQAIVMPYRRIKLLGPSQSPEEAAAAAAVAGEETAAGSADATATSVPADTAASVAPADAGETPTATTAAVTPGEVGAAAAVVHELQQLHQQQQPNQQQQPQQPEKQQQQQPQQEQQQQQHQPQKQQHQEPQDARGQSKGEHQQHQEQQQQNPGEQTPAGEENQTKQKQQQQQQQAAAGESDGSAFGGLLPLPPSSASSSSSSSKRGALLYVSVAFPRETSAGSLSSSSTYAGNGVVKMLHMEILATMKELLKTSYFYKEHFDQGPGSGVQVIRFYNIDYPQKLADLVAGISFARRDELQAVLAEEDIEKRLMLVLQIAKKDLEFAKLQVNVKAQVEDKVMKVQRKFLLQEQLKLIKKELGLNKDDKESIIDQFREILAKKEAFMNEEVQKASKASTLNPRSRTAVATEINKLSSLDQSSSEFHVSRTYLENLLKLPWGEYSTDCTDIDEAARVLNADHFGLEDVKKRILEFIAVNILKKDSQGKILCFLGPPGVGKTSVAESIARALKRKYYRISLGGLFDVAELRGHRRTYIGALPGKIVTALKLTGTMNPLIVLDEIDKLGRDFRGDPSSALLEVLDPSQNSFFRDHYIDVPLDLSRVLFVCTANAQDTIPGPLLDRMELIRIAGYIQEEKVAIAQQYLIPKTAEATGLQGSRVSIQPAALEVLVRDYAREAGVRSLSKCIEKLFRRAALSIVKKEAEEVVVTEENLTTFVDQPPWSSTRLFEKTQP
ncbi:lon protease, putative, partial [Eimeria maxima]